jgi:hypothetical protein
MEWNMVVHYFGARQGFCHVVNARPCYTIKLDLLLRAMQKYIKPPTHQLPYEGQCNGNRPSEPAGIQLQDAAAETLLLTQWIYPLISRQAMRKPT